MKKFTIFIAFRLIAGLRASPVSEGGSHTPIVSTTVYNESFIKYKGEYDIVDIMVPLNAINFGDNDSDEYHPTDMTVFFVEADIKDGKREYKGLYRFKNDKTKMILATGRSAAASTNDNKLVFFGASDGLYVYNVDSERADKYGSITDGIISIATDETGKIIYILTEDHKLYQVTNNGETKELIENVEDAQEIVIDDGGNLYYYTSKKEVFVKTADKIMKINGLPNNPESIKCVRPPFIISNTIVMTYDNVMFEVSANGTVEKLPFEFSPGAVPTAFGVETVYVQYYANDKKFYEFDILHITTNHESNKIKNKAENIRKQVNKNKHTLGAKKGKIIGLVNL